MGCRCLEPMCLVICDRPSFWLCPVPVDNLWVTLAWWVSWLFCTRPLCMRRKLKFSFWNINLLQFFSTFWQLSPLRVESGLESLFFTPVREIMAGKSYSLISPHDFVTHCSICTSISFWLISLGLIKQDGAESQFWKIQGLILQQFLTPELSISDCVSHGPLILAFVCLSLKGFARFWTWTFQIIELFFFWFALQCRTYFLKCARELPCCWGSVK